VQLFLWIALLAASGAGLAFAGDITQDGVGTGYRILRVAAAVAAAIAAVPHLRAIIKLVWAHPVIILFSIWTFVTALWSDDRSQALTTGIGVITVALVAAVLATASGRPVRTLMMVFTVTSVLSLAAIALAPEVATEVVNHPTEGIKVQANGIYGWNSDYAFSAAVGTVAGVVLVCETRKARYLVPVVIGVAAIASADSVATIFAVVAAIIIALLITLPVSRLATILSAVFLALAALVGAFATSIVSGILQRVGRSGDLTGRTQLWRLGWLLIQQHPLIGWGAGAQPDFLNLIGYEVNHLHNGFLQVTFDRGLVGLILVLLILLFPIIRWLRGSVRARRMAPFLVLVIVANIANAYITFASLGTTIMLWALLMSGPNETIDRNPQVVGPPRESLRDIISRALGVSAGPAASVASTELLTPVRGTQRKLAPAPLRRHE
jgi:O-antigen ligase